jgi:hypothetical protein
MAENVRRDEGHQSFISIQVMVLNHEQDHLVIVTNDQALPWIFNIEHYSPPDMNISLHHSRLY